MKTITDKFGISKMWQLTKYISVFGLIMVVCIGCGEQNLDDPKVREKVLAEAIEYDKLQTRRAPSGEELPYAPNQEQPYSGWVKSDSWDIIDTAYDDFDNENISYMTQDLHVGDPGGMELAQYQHGKLHGSYINWWDSNQQNVFRCAFMNGKLHGLVTMWYENGQKTLEGTCKSGLMNGRWTTWDENGQKRMEGTWKNDKRDGLWTVWHENGQKELEGTYKNGKEDGLWTVWHENGQKGGEGYFKNGKQDGLLIEWDENGQEISRETYKDGEEVE